MSNKISRLKEKMESSGLEDPDWHIPHVIPGEPLDGFPEVPAVRAGDGGLWVPVYVYLPKKEELP